MRDIMLEFEDLTYRLLEIEKPESLTKGSARFVGRTTGRRFPHKQLDLPFPNRMSNPEKQQQSIKFGKYSEPPSGSKQRNLFDRPLD